MALPDGVRRPGNASERHRYRHSRRHRPQARASQRRTLPTVTARRYTIDVPPEWLRWPRCSRRDVPETTSRPLTATVAEWAIEGQVRRAERQQQDSDDDGR